jgi:hypothetical protein
LGQEKVTIGPDGRGEAEWLDDHQHEERLEVDLHVGVENR